MNKKVFVFVGLLAVLSSLFTACNKSEDAQTSTSNDVVNLPTIRLKADTTVRRLKSEGCSYSYMQVTFRKKLVRVLKITGAGTLKDWGTVYYMLPQSIPQNLLNNGEPLNYCTYEEAIKFSEEGWYVPTDIEASSNLVDILKDLGNKNLPNLLNVTAAPKTSVIINGAKKNADKYYYWMNNVNMDALAPFYDGRSAIQMPSSYTDFWGWDLPQLSKEKDKASILLVKRITTN